MDIRVIIVAAAVIFGAGTVVGQLGKALTGDAYCDAVTQAKADVPSCN